MLQNSIKARFLEQLDSNQRPLTERLDLAFGANVSQQFHLPNKEQIIQDWFAKCLQLHQSHLTSILKVIKRDLAHQMSVLSDPTDASKLIEAFTDISKNKESKENKLIVKCLLLLLKNAGFQRYCRFEILPMCEATILACQLLSNFQAPKDSLDASNCGTDDKFVKAGLEDIVASIHTMFKITQQRQELQRCFVTSLIPALLVLKCNILHSTALQNLFEEMVVGQDWKLVCEAFKNTTTSKIPPHIKALVNLMTNNEQLCDIVSLNSLLLDVFVQSCMKNSKPKHKYLTMFYILTSVTGISVQLPYTTVLNSQLVGAQQLSLLRALINVLHKHNIPVVSESKEGTLSIYLIDLVKLLLSKRFSVSVSLLKTLQTFFNFYPESIRMVFSEFAQQIVFVKKCDSKTMKCYNNLLTSVVKTFYDLNQLDKFYALFSHKCVLAERDYRLEDLDIEMILTDGFFTFLSQKLPSLTGNQLKTIIGRMDKTFSTCVVPVLQTGNISGSNYKMYLKISTKLLSELLENAFIVSPTRWPVVSEEVKTLALTVQRFGDSVSSNLEEDLLLAFLQLVRVLVDFELLLNHYTISLASEQVTPRVLSTEEAVEVHSLGSDHGFLSVQQWKQIADFVEVTSNSQIRHNWFDLLVQKYVRSRDTEVVKYLVANADCQWLWQNFTRLSGSVPLELLELYTDQLVSPEAISAGDFNDKLSTLENIDVFTNKPLRAALNLAVIKQLVVAVVNKISLSRNLVKIIDISTVIQNEAAGNQGNKIVVTINALAEMVNQCQWDENHACISQNDKDHLIRLMELTATLSPHCLKLETKRIYCLVLMGITYDLMEEEDLVHSLLDTLIGCLDDRGTVFPDRLDTRVLVTWLISTVPKQFVRCQELTRLVLSKVVHSLDQCVDSVSSLLQGQCDVLSATLETLIQVRRNKALKNKEEFRRLVKILISVASAMFGKEDNDDTLNLYALSLKAEMVFFKDQHPTLITHLSHYLNVLLKRLEEKATIKPNTIELIELTLKLKPHIGAGVFEHVNCLITKELCNIDYCPLLCYPTTVKAFLKSLPHQHFKRTMNEICKYQLKGLKHTVSNLCELWMIVLSAHLDRKRAVSNQKLLTLTLSQCYSVLQRDPAKMHPTLINLLHTIALSKSIILRGRLLDLILIILSQVPTDTEPHLLPNCLAVMDSLISTQPHLIFDRIPAYLQRLRKFIFSLVALASTTTVAFSSISTSSANHVTRIVKTIVDQHAKHFARISPYLIADVLHCLVSYTMESSVKSQLQNCACILLAICDIRGTQLLQSLLPLPETELFKVISTMFNKSYKYTGKV